MYSPLLGQMPGAYQGTDSTTILPGSGSGELTAMSSEVRYRNRGQYSDDTAYLPGDYFVAITANADVQGDTWVQPYKLAIQVVGEATGAPRYVGGETVSQPLEESTDEEEQTEAKEDPAAENTGSPAPAEDGTWLSAGFASGVGVGLLAALVAVVLVRRRNRDAG
jgi:hypothetical protein